MYTYIVDMITDMDEPVRVEVQAYDQTEAEANAFTMLERGELDCVGQICAQCTSYLT